MTSNSKTPVPTPDDLEITIRDRRFGRDSTARRWWLNDDPIGSCWFYALSLTFPRGEAFFIDAVKAHRDGVPPRLDAEIRAFIKQEIHHTREHIVFNKAAEQAGYDVNQINERIESLIGEASEQAPIVRLCMTMALEHFTAMFAHDFLRNPQHFLNAEVEQAELWRWHAVEEIEHKGVAYDTWLHATRDWSRWKRWKVKTLIMLFVTKDFLSHRVTDTLDLLEQDGIGRGEGRRRLFGYLFAKPGVLRRIFPAWLAYFMPGFHPWNIDDRELIEKYDSEFADANLSKETVPAE